MDLVVGLGLESKSILGGQRRGDSAGEIPHDQPAPHDPNTGWHECLAAGLGVKSHFLHQADAWLQGTPGLTLPCWPRLCLGTDAVSSEGTPRGLATLVRRH